MSDRKKRLKLGDVVEVAGDKCVYIGKTKVSGADGMITKTFNVYAALKDYEDQALDSSKIMSSLYGRKEWNGGIIEFDGSDQRGRKSEKPNDQRLAERLLLNVYKGGYVLPTVRILQENLMRYKNKLPTKNKLTNKLGKEATPYLSCERYVRDGFYGASTGFEYYNVAINTKGNYQAINFHGGPHGGDNSSDREVRARFVKLELVES